MSPSEVTLLSFNITVSLSKCNHLDLVLNLIRISVSDLIFWEFWIAVNSSEGCFIASAFHYRTPALPGVQVSQAGGFGDRFWRVWKSGSLEGSAALRRGRGTGRPPPVPGKATGRRNWSWLTNPSYFAGVRETFSGLFSAVFPGNTQCEILSKGLLVIDKSKCQQSILQALIPLRGLDFQGCLLASIIDIVCKHWYKN